MNKHLFFLQSLIDKLSTRERILVLLGVISVLYMLWNTFLLVPVQKFNNNLSNERIGIQEQMTNLEKRRILASGLLQNKKRNKLNNEIARVENKIKTFDVKILERLQDRVSPDYMVTMLSDVLKKSKNLQLLSINNLPAEPLMSKQQEGTTSGNNSNNNKKFMNTNTGMEKMVKQSVNSELAGVFMHLLELELQGRYLDILDYLKALENLPWKIFWDQVKLEVVEYPKVKVRIRVHTFSLKDGWLSV